MFRQSHTSFNKSHQWPFNGIDPTMWVFVEIQVVSVYLFHQVSKKRRMQNNSSGTKCPERDAINRTKPSKEGDAT